MLANEQVIDGRCERCGTEVVQRRSSSSGSSGSPTTRTDLLDDFDRLESWPERVMTMQRNWIGRSEGAEVDLPLRGAGARLPVFTTRPDTLFGATFFVLAPEHPDLDRADRGHRERGRGPRVRRRGACGSRPASAATRTREKTGVRARAHVVNPVNGEQIPIFVADYVLMEYGTGAIMAVPGPRPARLRVRPQVRPAGPSRSIEPADGAEAPADEAFVTQSEDVPDRQLRRLSTG